MAVTRTAVFRDQDENNDGIPDTNRNFNSIPDWNEPFLMYESDPNEYVYGLDRNHNDEPDRREDDHDPRLSLRLRPARLPRSSPRYA